MRRDVALLVVAAILCGAKRESSDHEDYPAACFNGARDGGETDVDCGGVECPMCQDYRACAEDRDCETFTCVDVPAKGGKQCQVPSYPIDDTDFFDADV
eukprot:m51a1_g2411 hypothetical protein (99) ;mRNA; r:795658-795954